MTLARGPMMSSESWSRHCPPRSQSRLLLNYHCSNGPAHAATGNIRPACFRSPKLPSTRWHSFIAPALVGKALQRHVSSRHITWMTVPWQSLVVFGGQTVETEISSTGVKDPRTTCTTILSPSKKFNSNSIYFPLSNPWSRCLLLLHSSPSAPFFRQ